MDKGDDEKILRSMGWRFVYAKRNRGFEYTNSNLLVMLFNPLTFRLT